MKNFFRQLKFGLWMYGFIFSMWSYYTRVNKYRKAGNISGEISAIRALQHTWGCGVLKKFGIVYHVTGLENIPEEPVLFVSNHQSYADIPLFVAAIDRQIGFIAKADLIKIPIFGSWIKAVRSVFIKRNDARAALKTMEAGAELLRKGFSLGIFPEGTRSRGPNMLEFKRGSLKLATKTGVPIVPVAISGSYKSFEVHGYPEPAEVTFTILPAFETRNLTKLEANNLAEKIEALIKTELQSGQRNL